MNYFFDFRRFSIRIICTFLFLCYSNFIARFWRNALAVRYSFLPYWYTLFAMGEYDAQPPMAPMLHHFPRDPLTFKMDDQFMVGEAVLVHPVVKEGATYVEPYLPKGVWYLHDGWKVTFLSYFWCDFDNVACNACSRTERPFFIEPEHLFSAFKQLTDFTQQKPEP